jgi:hypothetical protein
MRQLMDKKHEYTNKVKSYIAMEYDEKLLSKIYEKKFAEVCSGYISNCYSLKKSIPYTANGIAKLLNKTK